MRYFVLTIKGFLIGIALIIPGLSGGTLAIYLGIYQRLLHAIGHIFTEMRKSLEFLIPLFLGMAISIVGLANVLGYLIDVNSLVVLMFFIGLVIGGMKDIYDKANQEKDIFKPSSILSFVVALTLVVLLVIFGTGNASGTGYLDINLGTIIVLILLGMAASMTMIVPGVSGSALLIVLGYYTAIVTNVVGNVFDMSQLGYNLQVIVPFALGAGVGIILFSTIIEHALNQYQTESYSAILGFLVGSVIAMFFEIKDPSTGATHDLQTPISSNLFEFLGENIWSLVGAILLLVSGFFIARWMTNLPQVTTVESDQ